MKNNDLTVFRDSGFEAEGIEVFSPASGYASPEYCYALREFGQPRFLPNSGGWLLERKVNDGQARDAMGCYPLFTCRHWSSLPDDLEQLKSSLVSITLVLDPLAMFPIERLRRSFTDVFKPFKEHFVVNLTASFEKNVSAHHRRYARASTRAAQIFRADNPLEFHADWCSLYRVLIERHGITGLRAFSDESFRKQLAVPGVHLFCARKDGKSLGMQIWFSQEERVYYHLGASSAEGYQLRVSYGLMWQALNYFRESGFRLANLGGSAGLNNKNDGLTRFKQGWSNITRTAYFAGRILDPVRYRELCGTCGRETNGYFPAYRYGEFKHGRQL